MRRMTTFLLILLAGLALLAAGCGSEDDTPTATDASEDTPTATDASEDTPTATDASEDTPTATDTSDDIAPPTNADVYFVWEVGSPSAGGVVEAVAATTRTVFKNSDRHPGVDALVALFDGPNDREVEIGMTSAVPESTEVLGLSVEDGVATVDVNPAFEEASGAFTDTLRIAQVVFTLTAFDDIDRVRFSVAGEVRETIGTHGVGVDRDGIGRGDVPEARPPILLESLAPDDDVTAPMTIRGEANTFEGTVRWALTDPDEVVIDEGFLTVAAGSDGWGTFEAEIGADADPSRSGRGAVILWEDSPEDGRQTNIVEMPITWTDV